MNRLLPLIFPIVICSAAYSQPDAVSPLERSSYKVKFTGNADSYDTAITIKRKPTGAMISWPSKDQHIVIHYFKKDNKVSIPSMVVAKGKKSSLKYRGQVFQGDQFSAKQSFGSFEKSVSLFIGQHQGQCLLSCNLVILNTKTSL